MADAQNAIRQLAEAVAAASRTAAGAEQQSLERAEALEALQQIAASFADIVASLEVLCNKPADTPGLAAALREAVASVRPPDVQVTVQPAILPEPKVSVTVQPAPVTVQPARDQPGQQWRMVPERPRNNPNAAPTAWIITRL